nr:thioredoxin domain-containing protein [Verrucomicrobiota bacterium]
GGHRPPLQEKVEGAFYVWTKNEIESALADDGPPFVFRYGVEEGGNAAPDADAHGELRGKNVLFERHTLAETAAKFGESEEKMRARLNFARTKLLAVRDRRPRPHLDDKITTAWNGLMISAFARGGQVLADAIYLQSAQRAATFLRENLYDANATTLARSYREGRSNVAGFADDYAFVIQGLLDLYEAFGESEWLRWAMDLQVTQDRLFYDAKHGGYFTTTGDDPSILLKMKDDSDSAEPAASSVSALNLARLGAMLDRAEYIKRAQATVQAFGTQLASYPSGLPQLLVAHDFLTGPIRQIVLAGDPGEFQNALRGIFLARTIVLFADGTAGQEFLASANDAITEMKPVRGKPAAYVCENFTCQAPVTDASALRKLCSGGL